MTYKSNDLFTVWVILVVTIMASNTRRNVASAISVKTLPSTDAKNLEALIDEFFNESGSDNDNDEECGEKL